ncbi:amidase signature enzyme [Mollisia scopiformis]|uniref:Amidase signature enzyme n=1 Tax=Mollisia scopiformis TaxID=149040 RepID=A0A194X376_MOLSC|nr:amidase signature enzyme [Mollisia scopiformis]KUJ14277.1 amidase signature enzyme [Mollisia scopiformis]
MIDLVRLSAADLQNLQATGRLTSTELAKLTLQQIDKYDKKGPQLRAMIAIVPENIILERAAFLDEERRAGRVLGPLHGIPILLKDIINTPPEWGILTTQGSWALEKSVHKAQAPLVQKLLDAGVIIIGKTSVTEFGSAKYIVSHPILNSSSYNVIGDQKALVACLLSTVRASLHMSKVLSSAVMNPLPIKRNPGGSSTGSAVDVAAGYSPVSIGGEANGSIQTPASRSNLYALKITPQTLSTEGIFHIVPTVESLGGMAKTVTDLEQVTKVIFQTAKTPVNLKVDHSKTWKDYKLGFVDPQKWRLPSDLFTATDDYRHQIDTAYNATQEKIKGLGGTVVYPVDPPHPSTIDGGFLAIVNGEFRDTVDAYLQNLASSEMRSLADIIQFNKDHPELQAGISQPWFIGPQEFQQTPEEYAKVKKQVHEDAAEKGLYRIMDELSLDIICSPTDGPICEISAMAGTLLPAPSSVSTQPFYMMVPTSAITGAPTATVPLGILEPSGRPFGLTFVGRPGSEAKLLELMYLYKAAAPQRKLPTLVE